MPSTTPSPQLPSSSSVPEIHHDARPLFCLSCNAELTVDPFLQTEDGNVIDEDRKEGSRSSATPSRTEHRASPQESTGTLGHYTTQQANIMALIADSNAPLQHPMCQECCDALSDAIDAAVGAVEAECVDYQTVLDDLTKAGGSTAGGDVHSRQRQVQALKADEAALDAQLKELLLEETQLDVELAAAAKDNKQLARERERLWYEYRDSTRKLLDLESDEQSVKARLTYVTSQLTVLSKTNVLNMAFHIWHDGVFGTINGLRLGRVPEQPVEWSEINTAWGHAALVLTCLARKLKFKFERFEPTAFGSNSYMAPVIVVDGGSTSDPTPDSPSNLPLYNMGGTKFLGNAKFDSAMIAFLDCMQQLQTAMDKTSPSFRLPYTMRKDKLVDKEKEYSVKTEFNSEERWTKAMKYMLTNMKWMLAWIASLYTV